MIAACDEEGVEDILLAITTGSLEEVEYWITKFPTFIHRRDIFGDNYTILHIAVQVGPLATVEFFLSRGADVDAMTPDQTTSLMIACLQENVDMAIVEALLDNGADIDHQNIDRNTALHWAVMNDDLNLVKLLISRGADISIEDYKHRTPLELAREMRCKSVVDYLTLLYHPDK